MKIVVDLGCKGYAGADSLLELERIFSPDVLYGFDPQPTRSESETVRITQAAAWTHDGDLRLIGSASGAFVRDEAAGKRVACFDFPAWLAAAATAKDTVIVKMDVEGAEYEILDAMIETDADRLVSLLIVEWHDHADRPTGRLRCPTTGWWL